MAPSDSTPPAQLGRYRILRRIGTGGMAEVFLAKSTGAEGIEKLLVVKRVLPTFARSAKFISMFTAEAKVAVRLNHPNIVQVYGFEQVKDEFLLAMEFLDGLDLGRLIAAARRRGVRLPYGIAAYVVQETAKGLDYAHKRRDDDGEPLEIVHRDVSPQNVLLSYEGVVKVADFGIAKARMVSEETGVIKGKFAYMSPEQGRGAKVDRRSDVYSLGVLLAELLMDRAMYPGKQGLDVLEEVRKANVTLPREVDPNVPEELDRIVRRATAFDPEERFQSARSLAGALAQYLHMQEDVYDGEALEQFLGQVAPRDRTDLEAARGEVRASTAATLASAAVASEGELRERRHVVVVAGRVRTESGGEPADGHRYSAPGVGDEAARVLSDIAYKADAVLTWPEGAGQNRFRFILGLAKPSVHDPLHAISLALDVREALQGLSADLLVPLTASLGVSRGVVSTVRDSSGRLLRYEPVGAVLEVAARLAEDCGPGEILAAGEVYRLARRVYAFDEGVERDISVQREPPSVQAEQEKMPRGIRAYRLRGALTREERAADALSTPGTEGLVGRQEELGSIVEMYQEATTARRSLYLAVVGDLGVGKSALVGTALQGLEPRPRVLHSECAFGTSDVPFAAAAEVVREACGIPDDSGAEEARAKLHQAAEELEPDLRRRETMVAGLELLVAPVGPAEQAQVDDADRSQLIMRAVEGLLRVLGRQGPLVIWVDALHWADSPSLELLRLLLKRNYGLPVVGILCTRPDTRIDSVLSSIPRIELGELDEAERRRLLGKRFGAQVPPDVERAICERAGGNPFFLIELVDALLERGAVAIQEGHGQVPRVVRRPEVAIALPTTLEGVIAARLGELPEQQRRALRWLAVAGPGLRPEDLSTLAGADLGGPLRGLEERGLVRRRQGGAYGFPSAVIRHVAYETADAEDRVRMHRRIANHLRQVAGGAPPARIARHLEEAGELHDAAEAFFEAAQAARRVYSNREALRFYGRALSLLPSDAPRRFWAHEASEQILRGLGRRSEQLQELESMRSIAEEYGDPSMRAVVYNRLVRHALDGSELRQADSFLKRALESAVEAGEKGAEVEALRQTAHLARARGDTSQALEACDRALELAGLERGLLAARGSVLVQRAMVLMRTGRLEEALEANAEALVIFRRLGIKRNEAQALNVFGIGLASCGALEDAITVIRASILLDREIGDHFHLGRKLSNIGQLYSELGDVERAVAFLRRSLEVFERVDDEVARSDALSSIAEALLEEGRDPEAASLELDQARLLAERTGDRYDLARERVDRAAVENGAGRLEQAEQCAREAIDHAQRGGIVSYELRGLAVLAESLAGQGRREEALDAARRVRERLQAQGGIERAERVHMSVARALATLGETEEAQSAIDDASRLVAARAEQIRNETMRTRYVESRGLQGLRTAAG